MIGVEAGAAGEDYVVRPQADNRTRVKLLAVRQVAVTVYGPLGRTRGARCVKPEGGVIACRGSGAQLRGSFLHDVAQAIFAGRLRLTIDEDYMFEKRQLAAPRAQRRPESLGRNQRTGPSVANEKDLLVLCHSPAYGRGHSTHLESTVERSHKLGP